MKVIGITGGVGAGKSTVLSVIEEVASCVVIKTDDVARSITMRNGEAFLPLVGLLGDGIVGEDGEIDRKKMADIIFSDASLCAKVNGIVHPLTKDEVRRQVNAARDDGKYEYAFIESALLIEAGYRELCDSFWYVYASDDVRIGRLIKWRGYTLRKCREIMANQLGEDEYRRNCDLVIDNSKDREHVKTQVVLALGK